MNLAATSAGSSLVDWGDYFTAARWVREVARPRWPHATTNDLAWTYSVMAWARGEAVRCG